MGRYRKHALPVVVILLVDFTVSGNAEFGGNISVAGTITYDDVTFVDSIGVVTARSGIELGAGSITPVIAIEAATETTTTTSASNIDSFVLLLLDLHNIKFK